MCIKGCNLHADSDSSGACDAVAVLRICLQGQKPQLEVARDLFSILSKSDSNLRQPVAHPEQDRQLLQYGRMHSAVGKSILQMLQVGSSNLPLSLMLKTSVCASFGTFQLVPIWQHLTQSSTLPNPHVVHWGHCAQTLCPDIVPTVFTKVRTALPRPVSDVML